MTTKTDDIKLPPLPDISGMSIFGRPLAKKIVRAMRHYAYISVVPYVHRIEELEAQIASQSADAQAQSDELKSILAAARDAGWSFEKRADGVTHMVPLVVGTAQAQPSALCNQPAAPVAQEPVAWTTPDGREPISAELKRARPDLYGKNCTVPLGSIAAQAQQPMKVPSENDLWPNGEIRYCCDRCGMTLGAEVVLEIANDFNPHQPTQDREDAERYRFWRDEARNTFDGGRAIDLIEAGGTRMDAAIDAARAAKETDHG